MGGAARRDRAAAALGLGLGKDHTLAFTPENEPYDPLFGT